MEAVQKYSELTLVLISVWFLASTAVNVRAQDQSGQEFVGVTCSYDVFQLDEISPHLVNISSFHDDIRK